MRIATGFAFALASLGSVLYFMPLDTAPRHAAGHVAEFSSTPATAASTVLWPSEPGVPSAVTTARVFSPDKPLLRDPPAAAGPAPSFVAPVAPKFADPGQRKLSSSRPADDDARRELVRDLQRELKRVGCFEGEATGTWGPTTKKAMTAFTERVNATLPLEEPDYILLTLVQGHSAQACGKSCPSEQAMNEDGKCLPRAIVAQKAKRATGKVALAEKPADPKAAERQLAERAKGRANLPSQSKETRVSTAWSTVVTVPEAAAPPSLRQLPALPGRMAIGAPIDAGTPAIDRAEVERAKAAKRKVALLQAERNASEADRQRRVAELEQRPNDAATNAQPNSPGLVARGAASAQTASASVDLPTADAGNTGEVVTQPGSAALNKPEPQLPEKKVKQGPSYRPATVIGRATTITTYRVTSPRFVSPPYGIGRIASTALRPSYAPEPRRWTRTIFTDITRIR